MYTRDFRKVSAIMIKWYEYVYYKNQIPLTSSFSHILTALASRMNSTEADPLPSATHKPLSIAQTPRLTQPALYTISNFRFILSIYISCLCCVRQKAATAFSASARARDRPYCESARNCRRQYKVVAKFLVSGTQARASFFLRGLRVRAARLCS